jgi:transcriptional regulator with XRE-family HTH domain
MPFRIKKVRTETLNEYLVEVRQAAGLSIDEVAEKTGIGLKFLHHLENGEYTQLPPNVYVTGFLKQLASLYAVSGEALLEQFKKERGIAKQVAMKVPDQNTKLKSFFSRIVLTPKLMAFGAAAGFIGLTIIYLVIQLVLVGSAPKLRIIEPAQGQLVKQSFVKISGVTDPGTSLTVNGQNSIFVTADGQFTTTIPVVAGQTNLVFKDVNKFAKSTEQTVPIVVDLSGAPPDAATAPPAGKELSLKLDFLQPVTLGLTIDGTVMPPQNMDTGSTTTVTAKSLILVSTTDGGKTLVALNGQKMGKLGPNGKPMNDVPFSLETLGSLPNPVAAGTQSTVFNKN